MGSMSDCVARVIDRATNLKTEKHAQPLTRVRLGIGNLDKKKMRRARKAPARRARRIFNGALRALLHALDENLRRLRPHDGLGDLGKPAARLFLKADDGDTNIVSAHGEIQSLV